MRISFLQKLWVTAAAIYSDSAEIVITGSDLDKKLSYVNQSWLDFTGLSEADLVSNLKQVVHPEDYGKCHEIYERAFAQRRPFQKECRLRRHDFPFTKNQIRE